MCHTPGSRQSRRRPRGVRHGVGVGRTGYLLPLALAFFRLSHLRRATSISLPTPNNRAPIARNPATTANGPQKGASTHHQDHEATAPNPASFIVTKIRPKIPRIGNAGRALGPVYGFVAITHPPTRLDQPEPWR